MTNESLRQKGEQLIPAVAYGDAAGLPVETRTAEYIADHYGAIDKLIGSSENPFYIGHASPGMWSDDTELSLAVAQGLIEADRFDLDAQIAHHIAAYDASPDIIRKGVKVKRGWGGSTTSAVERLKAGVAPSVSGAPDGAGNGVLMKMAPLAYWHVARSTPSEQRYTHYDQLTTMTHDSDIARLTTRVHADMLDYLATKPYEKAAFLDRLTDSITVHAAVCGLNENEYQDIFSYLAGTLSKEAILAHTDKKGFYAPQTLAMAYGAFIAHEGDLKSGVYEAVNLGGDTDSTASIVGAMAVMAAETVQLPEDSVKIHELHKIQSISRDMANAALRVR